ncbi:hypothetical protein QZM18_19125 [Burkholderia diffusa]|uniref:hypothetical protein n=1 Tax=Burkholderia diffusa TaxID=488732 RepID=UPI00264D8CD8|nr:hypothetical protein [Burkholderia diffusa]MDN7906212.1 hypothetical protein [Burkholderia diffusa]
MLFDTYVQQTTIWWNNWLRRVYDLERTGQTDSNGGKIFYPTMLICTKCHGYYVAELFGASETFESLVVKRHEEESIYRYLNQFKGDSVNSLFGFDAFNNGISNLCMANGAPGEDVEERFPIVNHFDTRVINEKNDGSFIEFGENFTSMWLDNCVMLNKDGQLTRCKFVLHAQIVRSSISHQKLSEQLEAEANDANIQGILTVRRGQEHSVAIAGQLQAMYLFPNLRETTVGEFFRAHPQIIKAALGTDEYHYEPYLEWVEHDGTCGDTAINPDLLVKRADGFFDIYDLKTALLDRSSITKAERKRRRFIDYVNEGIAQLANYREYFSYSGNADLARQKYGVEVKDPKLILVVGSWENVDPVEVNQACRMYAGVEIIDYDTLCQMFLKNSLTPLDARRVAA